MKQQRRVTLNYIRGLCKPMKDADAKDHVGYFKLTIICTLMLMS